ncbi:MAG: hypothetical protein MAGBODY4_00715 [Candidatus Marinimicrobia bacterium]|nr:hypothetical protein [Candidatus Neomarinimicrobiota bacterium]
MGATALQHIVELFRFRFQGFLELLQRRNQVLLDAHLSGEMHRRGNHIIGRLRHVHVIVGMDRFFAHFSAEDLRRDVGDNLVGIHVGGGAAAGLKNVEDELIIQVPIDDPLSRLSDGIGDRVIQKIQNTVYLCR